MSTGRRRMASVKKLKGELVKEIQIDCGYFTNNTDRMKYNEYLKAGYPMATKVIEGACCRLVIDRMERSGIRWSVEGAQPMLHIRAVPAAGQALPDGLYTRRTPTKGFRFAFYISSPFPKLAWRNHIDPRVERCGDNPAGVIKMMACKVGFLSMSAIARIRLIWQD